MRSLVGNSADLSVREITVGENRIPAALMWIEGLVDKKSLHETVLAPLLSANIPSELADSPPKLMDYVVRSTITAPGVERFFAAEAAVSKLVGGWTLLLANNGGEIVAVDTQGYAKRNIEEAATSTVIRGPRDGFVESLDINISLIRRRVRSGDVRVEKITLGQLSRTDVAMLYVNGKAPRAVVDEVRGRLAKLNIEGILESQYIEERIKDGPRSFFPTVYSTERPDDIAGIIMEGRVGILVDGTPFALGLPSTLPQHLQTTEDLYLAYPIATFVRWIRYLGFFFTLLLPSVYVGILTYHPEIVPPQLLSSILSARDGVPFPVLMEALVMEVIFEGLREASIRMPRSIGSAISIVGALVIGESAVQAGIISSPAVIVVAGTAIASFTIPSVSLSGAIRILRFGMLFLASLLGLYGIMIGLFLMAIHLSALSSIGVPYLKPFAPGTGRALEKTIFRIPWSQAKKGGK